MHFIYFSSLISHAKPSSTMLNRNGKSRHIALVPIAAVQSLSWVWLFPTIWTAEHQASLSFTNSWSFLKLISFESVMPSNHLILCPPLLLPLSIFPSIRVFSVSWVFASGGQSTGASASASILLMNIQDWFLPGLTGLISLQSKGISRVFPNIIA